MICEKCFKEIEDDSRFCLFCGASQVIEGEYNKGDLVVYSNKEKFGFKDRDSLEVVVPLKYDYIGPFHEGKAVVMINTRYGYVDKNGNELTRFKYDFAEDFKNGFAKVMRDNKWTLINSKCEEIVPFHYDKINDFNNGLALVELKEKFTLIDKNGKQITEKYYDNIEIVNDFIIVELDGFLGVLSKEGTQILTCDFDEIEVFFKNLLKVKLNEKFGLYNKNRNELLPCVYTSIQKFANNLIKIEVDNKFGFLDKNGLPLIDCVYSKLFELNENLFALYDGDSYIAIDNLGQDSSNDQIFLKFLKNKYRAKLFKYAMFVFWGLIVVMIFDGYTGKLGVYYQTRIILFGEEKVMMQDYSSNNDISIMYRYLNKYPSGTYADIAKRRIEVKNWEQSLARNTINGYQNYLDQHPDGLYEQYARERILWLQSQDADTYTSYKRYLKEFPEGNFSKIAKEKIENISWQSVVNRNTDASYRAYLREYPNGPHSTQAKVALKKWNKIDEIIQHLRTYGEDIYTEKAVNEIAKFGYKFLIYKVSFSDNVNPQIVSESFAKSRVTYIRPHVSLISTVNQPVEISYTKKDPDGYYAYFNGDESMVRDGKIIFEKFYLKRGINIIAFSRGWGQAEPGKWEIGKYEFEFFIAGESLGIHYLTIY